MVMQRVGVQNFEPLCGNYTINYIDHPTLAFHYKA